MAKAAADSKNRPPQSGQSIRRRALAFAAIAMVLIGPFTPPAHALRPTEYDIEAAYLFNFMRFVEWPPALLAKSDSLHVCVLGEDPFGEVLDATLAGGTIAGKRVTALRISNAEQFPDCHILFISSSESGRLSDILLTLNKIPILTVSDTPHFVDRGGMVEFTVQRGKVRFAINLAASSGVGLGLSSDLLKLATRVNNAQEGS